MVDCDSPDDARTAIAHLEQCSLGFACFESSHSHFWVFPGLSFSSFEAAHSFLSHIPGCDRRYLTMAKDKREFIVRAEAKEGEAKHRGIFAQPKLIKSTIKDPAAKAFIDTLNVHFASLPIKDLTRLRLTGAGWPEGKGVYGCWSQAQELEFMEESVRSRGGLTSGLGPYTTMEEDRFSDDEDFLNRLRNL